MVDKIIKQFKEQNKNRPAMMEMLDENFQR
jgi:hypothetical protein